MVFEFTKKPEAPDTTLGERIVGEMAPILQKCNRAYLEAVHKVGTCSVLKHLPEYFTNTNSGLVEEVDSLRNLLRSGKLRRDPAAYMRLPDFQRLYNTHCKEMGFKQERLNKGMYAAPFFELSAAVVADTREYPPQSGCHVHCRWVVGLEENRSAYGDM